jgi:hypothetical protein
VGFSTKIMIVACRWAFFARRRTNGKGTKKTFAWMCVDVSFCMIGNLTRPQHSHIGGSNYA